MLYLDHNATTSLDPRVAEAMAPYARQYYGNPSSLYRLGRISRSAVDVARQQVADLLGVEPPRVIFTSGATEANNWAIYGLLSRRPPGVMAVGATEHASVLEAARALVEHGWRVITIPVNEQGVIEPSVLADVLQKHRPTLVSIMYANNENGVIQDIAELGGVLNAATVWFHCDAVQAAGKCPLRFAATTPQLISLSSHKMYGPKGVGALVVAPEFPLSPSLYGGGQEAGLRAGTENVPAIVGFGRAAELAREELSERQAHYQRLRDRLEAELTALGAEIFGVAALRLDNTTQFAFPEHDGEMLVMLCDRQQIAVSSASACGSGVDQPSHVLTAMGVPTDLARGALRVSFGTDNQMSDVDRLLAVLRDVVVGTAAPA